MNTPSYGLGGLGSAVVPPTPLITTSELIASAIPLVMKIVEVPSPFEIAPPGDGATVSDSGVPMPFDAKPFGSDLSGHIGILVPVDRNSVGRYVFECSDKSGVDDPGARRIDLGKEAVRYDQSLRIESRAAFSIAAAQRVEGLPGSVGKSGDNVDANHIRFARRIDCNSIRHILILAAKIGGIQERRTIGADLGYKRILRKIQAATIVRLQSMRDGKVRRERSAGNERSIVRRHGNRIGAINVAAAQITSE